MPPSPFTIHNPLRILVLTTSPSTPIPPLISGPSLPLKTPYYTTTVPIWHDTIHPTVPSLQEWAHEWRSPEARDVVRSLGALILVTRNPSSSSSSSSPPTTSSGPEMDSIRLTLSTIHSTILHHHHHHSSSSSSYLTPDTTPLLLLITTPSALLPATPIPGPEWEDLCLSCGSEGGGWQHIDSEAVGKNAFHETTGLARLQEALETNDWEDDTDHDDEEDILDAASDNDDGFDGEVGLGDDEAGLRLVSKGEGDGSGSKDLEAGKRGEDGLGMREAILGRNDSYEEEDGTESDGQVEELETMMLKMQAVKERGAGLPEKDRKRLAAKAVREIMETI